MRSFAFYRTHCVIGFTNAISSFVVAFMSFAFRPRIATSIGLVGGLFQSRSKFGAGASRSNFNAILISE
jgi:hypothetical protein